jgi:methylmalonyl-CoA mutase
MDHSDVSLYVMTPEFGQPNWKNRHADFADLVAFNRDKRGALDALRDVKKQYQRNHNLWDASPDDICQFWNNLRSLMIQEWTRFQSDYG